MNRNRNRLGSMAKAAAKEYIRRYHRHGTGENRCSSALVNHFEAPFSLNTPDDHATRDIREGLAKLGDLRFKVLDSAGLETEASSESILNRTAAMTANVLARTQFAIFLIDVRPVFITDPLVHVFGEPTAISAETGLGMTPLYESLRPMFESYMNKGLDVIETYEKWCLRLSTARLNRWLHKAYEPAFLERPRCSNQNQVFFVAFVSGNTKLSDTYIRFLTKSFKEDFDTGGIPIRIVQRSVPRMAGGNSSKTSQSSGKTAEHTPSDKRSVLVYALSLIEM
ncbi:hypothetical protein V6N12_057580 [Hibiscus sabdariffa]|uniref:GTPase Der C-terminal KH-domain-like domain-containing protein n=1 Tax=Hibiscus sabdariffa TaxID=183260 RepID=A0ABR2C5I7_9ROSI